MRKKILYTIIALTLSFLFFNCGAPVKNSGNLISVEKAAAPGDEITLKIIDGNGYFREALIRTIYQISDVNDANDELALNGVFFPAEIINGRGTQKIKIRVPKNAISGSFSALVYQDNKDNVGSVESENTLEILYPSLLNASIYNVKFNDKITLTSSEPFFDEKTFDKTKLDNLFESGYRLIWIKRDGILYSLSNDCIDKETVTPNSVTFTVPESMKSGFIHIINEGGFNSNISSNSFGYAFYSTDKIITIE